MSVPVKSIFFFWTALMLLTGALSQTKKQLPEYIF